MSPYRFRLSSVEVEIVLAFASRTDGNVRDPQEKKLISKLERAAMRWRRGLTDQEHADNIADSSGEVT